MSCACTYNLGESHPVFDSGLDLSHTIPVRLHGDAARYQKRLQGPNRILILSTASGLVSGESWDTRWLFSVLDTRLLWRTETLHQLEEVYRVGVSHLTNVGRWPVSNLIDPSLPWPAGSLHASKRGDLIAGPFKFAFVGMKGDLEWRRDALRERRKYGTTSMCPEMFCQ